MSGKSFLLRRLLEKTDHEREEFVVKCRIQLIGITFMKRTNRQLYLQANPSPSFQNHLSESDQRERRSSVRNLE